MSVQTWLWFAVWLAFSYALFAAAHYTDKDL